MNPYLDLVDLSSVKAFAFDCFGTIATIHCRRDPYQKLIRLLQRDGIPVPIDIKRRIMTMPGGLVEFALDLGFRDFAALGELGRELLEECESIRIDVAAAKCLSNLAYKGYRIGVCSNLAHPYAAPVLSALPNLDVYAWSFRVGAVKPEPTIFEVLCSGLNCDPSEVVFIGDHLMNDIAGAKRFGMQAILYDPVGNSSGSIALLDEFGDFVPAAASR